MANDFHSILEKHKDLPEDAQKKAGQAIAGNMDEEHRNFVKTITRMIDAEEISVTDPKTFLTPQYDKLDDEGKRKVDIANINIADLLRHIADFYTSKKTPDESPHLQTMIEQLWAMKQRVELAKGDVFKF